MTWFRTSRFSSLIHLSSPTPPAMMRKEGVFFIQALHSAQGLMHFSHAHVNPFLLYEAGSRRVYTSLKCVASREQPTSPAECRERAVSCHTLGISACGPEDHHITGCLTLPDRMKSSRQLGEYVLPASDSHAATDADPFFVISRKAQGHSS